MTATELLEKLKEGVWLNAIIHKSSNVQFSITLKNGTITTNEGANGIIRYSKKRFLKLCEGFTFSIS